MKKLLCLLFLITTSLQAQFENHGNTSFIVKKHSTGFPAASYLQVDTSSVTGFEEWGFQKDNTKSLRADTSFAINATASDTSRAYKTAPNMAILVDFSGTTVEATATLYIGGWSDIDLEEPNTRREGVRGSPRKTTVPPPYDHFASADTYSITSTRGWWIITDGAIPADSWFYIVITGTGSNSADVTGKLRFVGWDPDYLTR